MDKTSIELAYTFAKMGYLFGVQGKSVTQLFDTLNESLLKGVSSIDLPAEEEMLAKQSTDLKGGDIL